MDLGVEIPSTEEQFYQNEEVLQFIIFNVYEQAEQEDDLLRQLYRLTNTDSTADLTERIYAQLLQSPLYVDPSGPSEPVTQVQNNDLAFMQTVCHELQAGGAEAPSVHLSTREAPAQQGREDGRARRLSEERCLQSV